MSLALVVGVGDLDRLDDSPGEPVEPVAVGWADDVVLAVLDELRLEAADHHLVPDGVVGLDAPGEALRVEQFEEGGPRLLVAVVGGGGEEEAVLEVGGDLSDGLGPLGVGGVAAHGGGGHVVHLVDHQDVERAGVGDLGGEGLAEEAERALGLHPVERRDHPGVAGPRVGPDPPAAPQLLDESGVDDLEVEAELLLHLDLPFELQRGGADDERGAGPVAEHQLLHDQAGLDGLAQADIVGDQQVDPRHPQGSDQGFELVVLDGDTAAERSLESLGIGIGHRRPADRVEEGLQRLGVVEVVRVGGGEVGPLVDAASGLQLPDDLDLVLPPVIVKRDQSDQVAGSVVVGTGGRRGQRRSVDALHHPWMTTDRHLLAGFGDAVSSRRSRVEVLGDRHQYVGAFGESADVRWRVLTIWRASEAELVVGERVIAGELLVEV